MNVFSAIKTKLLGVEVRWRPLLAVGGAMAATAGAYYLFSKFRYQHRKPTTDDCLVVGDPEFGSSQSSTSQSNSDSQDSGVQKDIHISAGPADNGGTLCGSGPCPAAPQRNMIADDFTLHKVLGRGGFGKVFLAEMKDDGHWFAMKVVKKAMVKRAHAIMVEKRVLALGQDHPFITHLHSTFQSEEHLFFLMEFLNGGDLSFHLMENGPFDISRVTFYAAEIVCGLQFLHSKGIIHRDVKLENVLMDREGHVKLADFGLCCENVSADNLASGFCGTLTYLAPEIIQRQKYSFSVDWWSFGVLLFIMLADELPFDGENRYELFRSICSDTPDYPQWRSLESTDILVQLFVRDPARRLGAQGDIRAHPFFSDINWSALERREIEPPFKPELDAPNDDSYFDAEVLCEDPCLSVCEEGVADKIDQNLFMGFTFTSQKIKNYME